MRLETTKDFPLQNGRDILFFKEKIEKLREYYGSRSPYSPKRLRDRQRERQARDNYFLLYYFEQVLASGLYFFRLSLHHHPIYFFPSPNIHPFPTIWDFLFSLQSCRRRKNLYGVSIGPSSRLNVPWDWGWSDAGTRLSLVLFPLVGCVLEHLLSPVNGENRTLNSGLGGH